MRTIARLFGKSPFSALQTHNQKVAGCVEKLTSIMHVLSQADMPTLERLSKELSELEHEADLTKNDIRNHLPNSVFLPIDRGQFLEILAIQDSVADDAEQLALLLTLHPLEKFDHFAIGVKEFYQKTLDTFTCAWNIMKEVEELLESSFGGLEAEKVKRMVEETALKEHQASLAKHALLKQLFHQGQQFPAPAFYLWVAVLEGIGNIAYSSEKLANRIRMILELK